MTKIRIRARAILSQEGEGPSRNHAAKRVPEARRYTFLETSAMARAMDHL